MYNLFLYIEREREIVNFLKLDYQQSLDWINNSKGAFNCYILQKREDKTPKRDQNKLELRQKVKHNTKQLVGATENSLFFLLVDSFIWQRRLQNKNKQNQINTNEYNG